MEEKDIKTIDIKEFKTSKHLDYADDDFVILNSLEGNPKNNDTYRLGCFLIAVCIEGCIQLDVNFKTYQLQAGEVLFGLPNTIIGHIMLSPTHQIKLTGFSTHFLQRSTALDRKTWDTAIHLSKNPIRSVDKEEENSCIKLFWKLIRSKINDEPHCYHKEVIRHLFAALFCEMMGGLNKEIVDSENTSNAREGITQAEHLLRKFLTLLSKDNGMHRSVAYYADALCYSSKYFSKIVKQACGKTPLELINETAMEHIKYRLKHSDKSIKEIAEEFNFPNQSFFGKYVKAHLGMSPARYRTSSSHTTS